MTRFQKLQANQTRKIMRKLLGYCGVDSGMLMVGDPCYFVGRDAVIQQRVKDWSTACNEIFCAAPAHDKNVSMDVYELGIAVETTYGDGRYPVYLQTNQSGRRSLIIKLD